MKVLLKRYSPFVLLLFVFISCQESEPKLEAIIAPSGLSVTSDISVDGSGIVVFNATAENAISYKYTFSDGTSEISPSGIVTKRFTKTGLNTYGVVVIAYGTGGNSSSTSFEVEVQSDFSDPEAIELLTGNGSKTWYWAASEPGHLGVGQNDADAANNFYPNFFSEVPFGKAGNPDSECIYEDQLVFTLDGETLKYELNNLGKTFFNVSYQDVAGGSAGFDFCYDFDTSGEKIVTLAPSESFVAGNGVEGQTRGTVMNFTDGGFMGYYIGATSYEILSLTANRMIVRAVQGNDDFLAWYHTFSTTDPLVEEEESLIWSDEFDTDGAPDSASWNYDLGDGCPDLCQWGNDEAQSYTNDPSNIVVEDGLLKITAIENAGNYTSARINSKGKFEFQYGRVEIRAKLPAGGGTWPALWMLGGDIDTNPWPGAGEIDIMEHAGNNQDVIQGATHDPINFGGDARKINTTISGVSDDFHVYGIEWTAAVITFTIDGVEYGSILNDANRPFDKDFYFVLNIAMGGSFGGAIDPAFTQSTMEVDYIRVYQ